MSLAPNQPITTLEPLRAGQRLRRAEFHERYAAMPPGTTFELVGGIVVMASPVGARHGRRSFELAGWLFRYILETPGVEGLENASVALDDRNEVQPDLLLRIESDRGGQTHHQGGMIGGGPELVVEVADSTRADDLGAKRSAYEQAGCQEYLVATLDPWDLHWHAQRGGQLVRIAPDPDGVYRSVVFPGLWLDSHALRGGNLPALIATLRQGLATAEHAAFVARLAAGSIGDAS